VVHPARQFTDLGVQRAAERHVDLLKAAADAQKGLPARHAFAHERQGYGIARAVEGAMRGRLLGAIFLGVDVGRGTGQKEAVEAVEQLPQAHMRGVGGNDHRHRPRDLAERRGIHLNGRMHGIDPMQDVRVADDRHHGARHGRLHSLTAPAYVPPRAG